MRKTPLVALLTLALVLGLVGLFAFTVESVHRSDDSARLFTDAPEPELTVSPPTGPELSPADPSHGFTLPY